MLYELGEDKPIYSKVERTNLKSIGWNEKDLETILSDNIQDFISSQDLMTISIERPWQKEPDILALDKEGNLYIFELKRWNLKPENVLQVLRYGQLYGSSNYDELNKMYNKYMIQKKYTDNDKVIIDLQKEHWLYFSLDKKSVIKKNEFNRRQNFIIVTNGLDRETIEAVLYWRKNGLNMDAIIYWVYKIDGRHFIEFNMFSSIETFLKYENNYYVLNANNFNDEKNTEDMLRDIKEAVYRGHWKNDVEKLKKDDTVFFYKNGVGVFACGTVCGNLDIKDYERDKKEEYFIRPDSFKKLLKSLRVSEMKAIGEVGFAFKQTMFAISEEVGKKLIEEIKENRL